MKLAASLFRLPKSTRRLIQVGGLDINMGKSLQQAFVESMGKAIRIGDFNVIQVARLPIRHGRVRVAFVSGKDRDRGVYVKAKGGWVEISDGSRTECLEVWRAPDLADLIEHTVDCPTGELSVWNVYRTTHANGEATEDMWTGNAGMVLLGEGPRRRRYGCSGGVGPFDPTELVVDVEWSDS